MQGRARERDPICFVENLGAGTPRRGGSAQPLIGVRRWQPGPAGPPARGAPLVQRIGASPPRGYGGGGGFVARAVSRCTGVGRTCNAPGHRACNAYGQGAQGVEAAAGVSRCTRCTCCKSLHGGGGALQCNDSAPTPGLWLRHLVSCPETCRTASDPAGAYGGAVTPHPAFVNHARVGAQCNP